MFDDIIKEIVAKHTKRVLELCGQFGEKRLSDVVTETSSICNSLAKEIIEEAYWEADNAYNQSRDIHKIVIKDSKKIRRMMTSIGELKLRRRLYQDKSTGQYFFAMDNMMKIEKYSRIDDSLREKLIKMATLTTYGKSSEFANGVVSRQTVFNLVKELSAVEAPVKNVNKSALVQVEADEDHIHLLNKQKGMMKMVYVHEGYSDDDVNRRTLINPRYFVTINDDVDTLWNDVAHYVNEHYIYAPLMLHGDGANWIKAGMNVFRSSEYVLDKFHTHKALISASAGDKKKLRKLKTLVKNKDERGLRQALDELYCVGGGVTKLQIESLIYLINNLDSIDLSSANCCSAEGHVSHVLSSRMSARPMCWSTDGAERIAKLRAFYYNGGDFAELIKNNPKKIHKKSFIETQNSYNRPCLLQGSDKNFLESRGQIVSFYGAKNEFYRKIHKIIDSL